MKAKPIGRARGLKEKKADYDQISEVQGFKA